MLSSSHTMTTSSTMGGGNGGGRLNAQESVAMVIAEAPSDVAAPMDEEMKEAAIAPSTPRSEWTSGSSSEHPTPSSAGLSAESAARSTWSFVQMNMSLLPIARPLPVSVCNRIHDGLIGRKPRTPNQKLHHRVLHNASNISPRRQDHHHGPGARRPSLSIDTSPANGRAVSAPMAIPGRGKRKSSDVEGMGAPSYLSTSWQPPTRSSPRLDDIYSDEMLRTRSLSEDLTMQEEGASVGSPHEQYVLHRSSSTNSGLAQKHHATLFKGKRILEIQDEERWLHPDDRAALPSPSKRSRVQH